MNSDTLFFTHNISLLFLKYTVNGKGPLCIYANEVDKSNAKVMKPSALNMMRHFIDIHCNLR